MARISGNKLVTDSGQRVELSSPRVRFNWGYHDGAHDKRSGWLAPWRSLNKPHYDAVYEKGYWAGYHDQESGSYEGNSTKAWEAQS